MPRKTLVAVLMLTIIASLRASGDVLFNSDTLARPSRTYDVLHYKLELSFEEKEKRVLGTTTISLVPLKSKLDSIVLDAVGLNVEKVLLRGRDSLHFGSTGKKLTVHFNRSYTFTDTLAIAITYSAVPKKGLYFLSPDSTDPKRHAQIWSQGEDMDNRHWFPCWDFPNDKASSEVVASVRDSWTLLSNGKLLGVRHDKKKKTKTFHWYQSQPHVSYLIMIAAGEYEVITEKESKIPIEYYLYKERVEDGKRSLSATPAIMKFFEQAIGPYPWEKYAQIFIDDFMWGGMENTGAVTLNTSYMMDKRGTLDFTADDVVAHELAHQWFGDLVTCRDWTEMWLNEGFANYYEALYQKHAKGFDAFQLSLMGQASTILGVESSQGRKPVVSSNSYPTNLYSKGAWVLFMLHNILGEEEFHRAIQYYLQRHAFESVSTCDLQRAVEVSTGQNLDWFFKQWLYKAGHPKLNVRSAWNEEEKELILTIQQTQPMDSLTGVFILPLDIECTTGAGKTATRVWLTKAEQEVHLPLPEKPLMVIVDKGMKLLKELKFERSKDELIYQLRNAEDIADRMEAAKLLKQYPDDAAVFEALRESALGDPFWAVRREATIYLGAMKADGVKPAMFSICNDGKSAVRNAAVTALEQFKSADVIDFLRNVLATDSSYIVQSSSLHALAEIDSANALGLALEYVEKESHRDILRRAALRVFRMLRSSEALTPAMKYVEPGNASDIRSLALGIIREVGEKSAAARSLMKNLAGDSNKTIRKGAVHTLGMWGGDDALDVLKQRGSIESDPDVKRELQLALEELSGK